MATGVFPSMNRYISSAYEDLLVATFVKEDTPLTLLPLSVGNPNQTWTISDTTETSGIITLKIDTKIEPNPAANSTIVAGNTTTVWAFQSNAEGLYTICDTNGINCWNVDNSQAAPGQEILYGPIADSGSPLYQWVFLAA